MCGIAGGITNQSLLEFKIIKSIKHRGPDADGFYQNNNTFLAHTRLSIIDLNDRSNQPMVSSDENFIISFNGEIYNHLEIRKELTEFHFKTGSDTETILNAYIKFGSQCLNMFNGIFAFAIFDKKNNEIFLARDHFGIKPLYVYQDPNQILFSSELKSFLNFKIDKSLDFNAISSYLTFLWSPGAATPFLNVKKILPGHYCIIDCKSSKIIKTKKYYQIPYTGVYQNKSEDEIINQLEEKLLKAVERQMMSDVPVGFFLSGGLDSSLLVAMAKRLNPEKKFKCYTINAQELDSKEGFSNDLFYAKKVADYLDVDLQIVDVKIDILQEFDKMVWHLDEPQADVAPINVLKISELAKDQGIKVLIGGAGGDDLFSGYRRHKALQYEKYISAIPNPLSKFIKYILSKLNYSNPFFRRLKKLTLDLDKSQEERLFGYFKWINDNEKLKLFDKSLWKEIEKNDVFKSFKEKLQEIPNEKNILNKMLYLEKSFFLTDHNLNYTDKLSMATGVEVRVPFLDVDLVNYATKIHPGLKLKRGETKYILKKVAERYLPKDVIYRPKTGFGAPVRKWIKEDLESLINKNLNRELVNSRSIFNYDSVNKMIIENKKNKIDASYTILSMLTLESWLQQFYD